MARFYKIVAAFLVGAGVYAGIVKWRTADPVISAKTPVGSIPDFTLLDHNGVIHQLSREADSKAVVIVSHGNSCPIVQKFSDRLNELNRKFANRGVVFWMINSNTADDRASIIREAKEFALELPILLDPAQIVGRALGLTRTTETVIIDPVRREVVYRGPINDRLDYGVDKQASRTEFLERALEEFLEGKNVTPASAQAKGCATSFQFKPKGEVSYAKDVAPILSAKCLNCHSEFGRFNPHFSDFSKVKSWTAMIRETIYTARMPPFSADPLYGRFLNDISLSPEQQRLFVQWIEDGALKDPSEADPLPDFVPDSKNKRLQGMELIHTATMPESAKVRPSGELEYRFYQLGGPAPRDLWIQALRVNTDNPRQLHHQSLMVTSKPLSVFEAMAKERRDEKLVRQDQDGALPSWTYLAMAEDQMYSDPNYVRVQAWGLGRKQPVVFRPGMALFVPKGHYLILETHHMGSGKWDSEKSSIDFYGTYDRKSLSPLKTKMVLSNKIEIPPGAKRFLVKTQPYKVPKTYEVVSVLGHLHMRGRAVKAFEVKADGTENVIVSIPNFYYGWQTGTGLSLETPYVVTKGSQIRVECEYDNSAMNPNNPDPTKTVHFGQTHDKSEMCKMNFVFRERPN